jgi:hypothetical protein
MSGLGQSSGVLRTDRIKRLQLDSSSRRHDPGKGGLLAGHCAVLCFRNGHDECCMTTIFSSAAVLRVRYSGRASLFLFFPSRIHSLSVSQYSGTGLIRSIHIRPTLYGVVLISHELPAADCSRPTTFGCEQCGYLILIIHEHLSGN